jgi:hypothetical protein
MRLANGNESAARIVGALPSNPLTYASSYSGPRIWGGRDSEIAGHHTRTRWHAGGRAQASAFGNPNFRYRPGDRRDRRRRSVIATSTAALGAGASTEEAARLANDAGGIVVMKRGTATVSAEELLEAIEKRLSEKTPHRA